MKKLSMKTLSVFLLSFMCLSAIAAPATVEEAKRRLSRYPGKLNGIEKLARAIGDSTIVADVTSIRTKIMSAINQATGMGSVDIDAVEADVEKNIYKAINSIYQQSIPLAAKTSLKEKVDNLSALVPWNKKLIWNADKTHILMTTWIPASYKGTYEPALGKPLKISWNAWVTAVPEIKDFLKQYLASEKNSFNLTDRLEQFLGLYPSKPPYAKSQTKLFVDMWVRPEDIFRPCLDSEVIDTECIYDPSGPDAAKLPPAFRDMSKFVTMTPEYKTWFAKEKNEKYSGEWAMPWTRFGYTYDWGSLKQTAGKRAAQGASEYGVKPGSTVIVHSIISTDDYPNAPTPKSGYVYQE